MIHFKRVITLADNADDVLTKDFVEIPKKFKNVAGA